MDYVVASICTSEAPVSDAEDKVHALKEDGRVWVCRVSDRLCAPI